MTKVKKGAFVALNQNKKPFKNKKDHSPKPHVLGNQQESVVKNKNKKQNTKFKQKLNKNKKAMQLAFKEEIISIENLKLNKPNVDIKIWKPSTKKQKQEVEHLANVDNKKKELMKFKGTKISLKENGELVPPAKDNAPLKKGSKKATTTDVKQNVEQVKKLSDKGQQKVVSNNLESIKKPAKPDESNKSQVDKSSKAKKQKKTVTNESKPAMSSKETVQESNNVPQSKKKKKLKDKKSQKELTKNSKGGNSTLLENVPAFDEEEFNRIVEKENIKKIIKALKNVVSEDLSSKSQIFTDYKYILNVTCFKIPMCPKRLVRLKLTHSLVDDDDDICLIVKDLKRGLRIDYEPTVQHYEDLLRDKGVTNIKAIIPFNQLKKEYGSYEMKIKLSNLYDYYLCDGAIIKHVAGFLGKKFQHIKCAPQPVRMNLENIKRELEKSLCRTVYKQGEKGSMISIPVGSHKMTAKKVADNIQTVISQLKQVYPGGLANIRNLYVRVNIKSTPALPIYVSIARPPENVPVVIGPKEQKLKELKQKANQILSQFQISDTAEFQHLSPAQVKAKRQRQQEQEEDEHPVPRKKNKQPEQENKESAATQLVGKKGNAVEKIVGVRKDSTKEDKQVEISKQKLKKVQSSKNDGAVKSGKGKNKEEIAVKKVEKKEDSVELDEEMDDSEFEEEEDELANDFIDDECDEQDEEDDASEEGEEEEDNDDDEGEDDKEQGDEEEEDNDDDETEDDSD